MTRWYVEKSGSGIEKAGSGIEKAGSGIEKAGSGIEKAGSGIRKSFLSLMVFMSSFCATAIADELNPEGTLQVVSNGESVAVSWIIDGSVFSGVSSLTGAYASLMLTEVGLIKQPQTIEINPSAIGIEVAGSGTGKEVAGSGTGKEVAGSGTGKEVAGSGTGTEVAGSGTGVEIAGSGTGTDVAGSGTGRQVAGSGTGTDVAGSGTGRHVAGSGTGTDVAGSGTGQEGADESPDSTILVAGSGTGSEAISITLPDGTGLQMEILMGCSTASVSVLDSNFAEVVTFSDVQVIGNTGLCDDYGFGGFDIAAVPESRDNGIR